MYDAGMLARNYASPAGDLQNALTSKRLQPPISSTGQHLEYVPGRYTTRSVKACIPVAGHSPNKMQTLRTKQGDLEV